MKNTRRTRKLLIIILLAIIMGLVWLFWPRKGIAPTGTVDNKVPSSTASVTETPVDFISLKWPENETIDVPILMYHHVGPLPEDADDIRKGLTVSADDFESQMKFLKDGGYNIVTLEKMYELVAVGKVPEKTTVLTFDDGYSDNFEAARSVMEEYGFKGTFFIISGKMGEDEYMNEDQIKELAAAGNEIGSHSAHHLSLDTLSGQRLIDEIENPKIVLEKLTGEKVVSFCYPAGKFTPTTVEAVGGAGYKIAVTTQKYQPFSTNKPFESPRLRINPGTNLKSVLK